MKPVGFNLKLSDNNRDKVTGNLRIVIHHCFQI